MFIVQESQCAAPLLGPCYRIYPSPAGGKQGHEGGGFSKFFFFSLLNHFVLESSETIYKLLYSKRVNQGTKQQHKEKKKKPVPLLSIFRAINKIKFLEHT